MDSPEATTPLVLRGDVAGVATLTLNRPATRNALSFAMLGALSDALAQIAGDDSVRVVILAAEGPVFCAGHDLREITAHRADPDGGRGFFDAAMRRFDAARSPNRHLAFGAGAHQCLGLHLARLEMRILFEALLDRVAAVEPAGEAKRASSTFVGGLKTLPLRVTPA